jgi:hypothetical protein
VRRYHFGKPVNRRFTHDGIDAGLGIEGEQIAGGFAPIRGHEAFLARRTAFGL